MGRRNAPRVKSPAANALPAMSRPRASDAPVTVVFSRAHTHRGVPYGKGDSYIASREERDLLALFGAIGVD